MPTTTTNKTTMTTTILLLLPMTTYYYYYCSAVHKYLDSNLWFVRVYEYTHNWRHNIAIPGALE
uniref:Uncharacterized protein n=1 Tax=Anguilla anguilla TaxID=7936 RepID=A0A0E9PYL8_ANGAN